MRHTARFSRNSRVLLNLLVLVGSLLWFSCGKSTEQQADRTATAPAETAPDTRTEKVILFFGNSLTAGYGLEPAEAFPALIGQKLDSAKMGYRVINAGVSGETSAGGKSRISWVLRQPVDVFVLELGANDGLRGLSLNATKQNLQAIIDTVKARSPATQIVIAGMEIPPNMGPEYTSRFREMFKELAQENNATLIPFLLANVAGIPQLNQGDGIHPTAEGNRIVAENVWKVLKPVLRMEPGT